MRRTVLIVDDDAPFRRAARELLTLEGYEVVGEAEDGESAVAAAARLGPAIVLLDVQLPDIAGVTVLVSGRTGNYRRRAAESPVAGFLLKGDLTGGALAGLVG